MKLTANPALGLFHVWVGSSGAKLVRVMKLTTIIILAVCLQSSANGLAQNTVTFSGKDVNLESVFTAIKKQTSYRFFFNTTIIQNASKITIEVKNAPIEQVLNLALKDQSLTFAIKGRTIFVMKKPEEEHKISFIGLPQNPIDVRGRVVNEKGEAVEGVTVAVKGSDKRTVTDKNGEFSLITVDQNAVLVFTHVGLETFELTVSGKTELAISLKTKVSALSDVIVTVNTGYQEIPKERATGSFVKVDNNLLNRTTSTDIISRLNGVASGVLINTPYYTDAQRNNISIRSRSTIFSNAQPLIVVDNFPYEGDISNINPNDIESITVLKDAAAASIWGVRAGNGVIVLTTKSGKYNDGTKVAINSNITFVEKPDFDYSPVLSSSDFIDLEKSLFDKGAYDNIISSPSRPILSPVVDILQKARAGQLSQTDADAQLNQLKTYDVRQDLKNYFYKSEARQQYAVNLNGGGVNNKYFVSVGFDKNLNVNNAIGQEYSRFSINARNTYAVLNKRLEITPSIQYWVSNTSLNGGQSLFSTTRLFPYTQLVNSDGTASTVTSDIRQSFKDTAGSGKLLDWNFRPYDELNYANNKLKQTAYIADISVRYKISKSVFVNATYRYDKSNFQTKNLHSLKSYYTRNLINQYYQPSAANKYPVPMGSILDDIDQDNITRYARGQINFSNTWGKKHNVSAIVGTDISDATHSLSSYRLYGYDEQHATSVPVDYVNSYKNYVTGIGSTIPNGLLNQELADRSVSFYSNFSYTYDGKYTISGSARKDGANIFGVKTNQQWKPLWSIGGKWDIDKEKFYGLSWLPYLKIRATYGYAGNYNKSIVAFLTTKAINSTNIFNQPYASLLNPPNDQLRWEKIAMTNWGIDFGLVDQRVSGSFEYYWKRSTDLIGDSPLDPTSGLLSYKGNTADSKGHGLDITINSRNIVGEFYWTTNFLFSFASDKIGTYKAQPLTAIQTIIGAESGNNPIVGKPVNALYSFRSDGLDPVNGNPLGYLNKQTTNNWAGILASTNLDELQYHGPSRPPYFGSIRNEVGWKQLILSFNIIYKLGYYFRRPSINYSSVVSSGAVSEDYNKRWTKPGDELTTTVPSMVYPFDNNRDMFYQYSSSLVEKADNIRLQDLILSYNLLKNGHRHLPFENIKISVIANNIGVLIWKANEKGLDPDRSPGTLTYFGVPNRSYSFALNVNF